MPVETIQVFSKPSLDTLWFHETWDPSHMEYITTNYKDTGKYSGKREITGDGLILISTLTFTDQSALDEWKADTYLTSMMEKRDIYNQANGIEKLV